MHDLVALDMPAGPAFVDALRTAWEQGDAVLPIDQRLPPAGRDALLRALAPGSLVDADGAAHPLADGQPVETGDALVMATSGTTGEPKGVVLTHHALAAHAHAVHEHLEVDENSDRWLACLPLSHMGGLGVIVRSLIRGVEFDVLPGFDEERVAAAPAELGSTLVSLVPTTLNRLGPAADAFRWVVLGGAPDAAGRPGNVVHTYGMTESGGGVVYDGRPLDGVEVRVIEGEIELRLRITLLRAYRDGSVPLDADGWLTTGDMGEWDGEQLVVHGRRSEMIITGGENVWPNAVEAVLASHPTVAEVAVIGRADPEWGQRVVAIVVPTNSTAPNLDSLKEHVRETLPSWAAPRELVLVEALPRTALGKVAIPDAWR